MTVVLDNSLVIDWLLGEPHAERADRIIVEAFDALIAPCLFWAELTYVLGKRLQRAEINRKFRDDSLQQVFALGIRTDRTAASPGPEFSRCMILGDQHGLTIYDAVYLELALRQGARLATFDAKLARAAQAAGVEVLPAL